MQLTQHDPRWVGAWWLGFVSLFGILIVSGTLLLFFPKKMKNGQVKRTLSIKEGHLPSSDHNIQFNLKGFIIESIKILFNKAFVLSVLAVSVKLLYAAGLIAFIGKLLILKFGVSDFESSIFLGAIFIPGLIRK